MRIAMIRRRFMVLTFCLGFFGLTGTIARCADLAHKTPVKVEFGERPTHAHPFTTVISKDGFVFRGGFPAISGDKSAVAIFYSDDAMSSSALIDVVRLADGKRLKHVSLLSETEGGRAADMGLQQKMQSRMASINQYLKRNAFVPMPELYELPTYVRQSLPSEERFNSSGKSIVFEYSTGTLTIASSVTGKEQLRIRQPVRRLGVSGGNPMDDCFVQGTPVKAWIDETVNAIILEVQYVGTRDSCEQPEEWLIQSIH